ncbi:MAG: hypothetical protein HXY23_08970 [Parvularculaceae bacterium]|nr:hypothetical protein [Parvularculaceae bacterium]
MTIGLALNRFQQHFVSGHTDMLIVFEEQLANVLSGDPSETERLEGFRRRLQLRLGARS